MSINLLLANEIQEVSALKWVFLATCVYLRGTCQSLWPPNASLYASSTCRYLRLLASRLTRALQNAHLLKMTGENHAMPGEELPHKKDGVRVGNLKKKNAKMYRDLFCGRGLNFFHPKCMGPILKQHIISCDVFFGLIP